MFPITASFADGYADPRGHMTVCYQETKLALNLLTTDTYLAQDCLLLALATLIYYSTVGDPYEYVTREISIFT